MAHREGKSLEEFSTVAEGDAKIDHFIDRKIQEEAKKGSVVLEGHLVCWMTRNIADLKIYLSASKKVRLRRVAERERVPSKEAKNILDLEERERVRWERLYEINLQDLSICDLIINTEALPPSLIIKLLENVAKELDKGR
jgi:cytidylate kinase